MKPGKPRRPATSSGPRRCIPAMRLTRCWPDFTQHTCNPNVIRPGETYIETPGVPVDATANHAATWMITEIFSDSHPGDPDGPGLKSLLTHDPGRIFRRWRASRLAAARPSVQPCLRL